jgi:hypothetical protein
MNDIFLSRPSALGPKCELAYEQFMRFLKKEQFKPRRLGKSDYSLKAPLHAVIDIMDECQGAIILGYAQVVIQHEIKRGTTVQASSGMVLPTPWNQIEGALAYFRKIPVMVIAQEGVSGGIFDYGVTGDFILTLDLCAPKWHLDDRFTQIYTQWKSRMTNKPAKLVVSV